MENAVNQMTASVKTFIKNRSFPVAFGLCTLGITAALLGLVALVLTVPYHIIAIGFVSMLIPFLGWGLAKDIKENNLG